MSDQTISYHQADELPAWVPTISSNGANPDFSTGWTFQVKVAASPTATAALTKTTNITGATGGAVTVAWAPNELDLEPGLYLCQLTATRSSDSAQETVEVDLEIKPRL